VLDIDARRQCLLSFATLARSCAKESLGLSSVRRIAQLLEGSTGRRLQMPRCRPTGAHRSGRPHILWAKPPGPLPALHRLWPAESGGGIMDSLGIPVTGIPLSRSLLLQLLSIGPRIGARFEPTISRAFDMRRLSSYSRRPPITC